MQKTSIHYRVQESTYLCGPACLQMVLASAGIRRTQRTLAKKMGTNHARGTTQSAMLAAARSYGLHATVHKGQTLREVEHALSRGALVVVNYVEPDDNNGHYAIVYRLTRKSVVLFDPWHGPRYTINRQSFLRRWRSENTKEARRWMMALTLS